MRMHGTVPIRGILDNTDMRMHGTVPIRGIMAQYLYEEACYSTDMRKLGTVPI
jgi:hypothetical protein